MSYQLIKSILLLEMTHLFESHIQEELLNESTGSKTERLVGKDTTDLWVKT
jgi:hypothetical protein